MPAVDLAGKLALFDDRWSPRVVASFNGHDVMVAKLEGEYVWHAHEDTDDFFLVLKGTLQIELEDGSVTLGPSQLYVVPKGVRHRPVAEGEVHILLMETAGEPNTGDSTERTPAEKTPI